MELSPLAWMENWRDENTGELYKNEPLAQDWARICKVSEELGKAVNAFIGTTGQNPRKGLTHDMDDVLEELADTALTAIYAIQHFTKNEQDTYGIITGRHDTHYSRVRGT